MLKSQVLQISTSICKQCEDHQIYGKYPVFRSLNWWQQKKSTCKLGKELVQVRRSWALLSALMFGCIGKLICKFCLFLFTVVSKSQSQLLLCAARTRLAFSTCQLSFYLVPNLKDKLLVSLPKLWPKLKKIFPFEILIYQTTQFWLRDSLQSCSWVHWNHDSMKRYLDVSWLFTWCQSKT